MSPVSQRDALARGRDVGVDAWGLRIFASRESRSPELPAADKLELEGVSFGAKKEAREFGSASSSELKRVKRG